MPCQPDENILGGIISVWRQNKSVNYMLLSKIYVAEGCWEDVQRVRMRYICGIKMPGFSWIEIGITVHIFVSVCKSHLQPYNCIHVGNYLHNGDGKLHFNAFMNEELQDWFRANFFPVISALMLSMISLNEAFWVHPTTVAAFFLQKLAKLAWNFSW